MVRELAQRLSPLAAVGSRAAPRMAGADTAKCLLKAKQLQILSSQSSIEMRINEVCIFKDVFFYLCCVTILSSLNYLKDSR